MTCQELIQFLDSYLDGSLSREERDRFVQHLGVCRPCVDYLDSYRTTVALERGAFEGDAPPPSEDIPEDLVQAILASRV